MTRRSPLARLKQLERATRPADPAVLDAVQRRWDTLPERVKTPAQLLGRRSPGCEGTHGVFPQCDFVCKPCYHSKDANRVRVDGAHTVAEVTRQMQYFQSQRGPGAHAQLIGGEVSLLSPDEHAATIEAMRAHGRMPMSFTHGDISYDYLTSLAVNPDGSRRLDFLSFAAHFDMLMFGRKGIEKPTNEAELNQYRQRFCDLFTRLKAEHGVGSYLAHNMTVTPSNLDQVADVIRDAKAMGYRMMSFQPAAYVGNEARWKETYREVTDETVWAEIERGTGDRMPYKAIQFGDFRCNRIVWGMWVGDRYVAALDDESAKDMLARDAFYESFPGLFLFVSKPLLAARIARAFVRRPKLVLIVGSWVARFVKRAGGVRAVVRAARAKTVIPMTFVMHNFMDARDVGAAWDLMKKGETSDDPRILATQERLAACAYSMAHPESDELVPACVQHSLLDPLENIELVKLLPITREDGRKRWVGEFART